MIGAQPLERRDDFVLRDFYGIGDHTRGLFEAEASIAASAAHPFEDVQVVFFAHSAPRSVLSHTAQRSRFNVSESVSIYLSPLPFSQSATACPFQETIPENPTFCAVIDSTLAAGLPFSSTNTLVRTNNRQASTRQITWKIKNAFSVTRPGGSLQSTAI